MPNIPKTMSTQHPDNVNSPFFAESAEMGGSDEIQEAYYVFSHLGCTEQMWDCEGKEVDNFVVKKLLSKYESYFKNKRLGKDLFLTLRVPNPDCEKAEAKILLETLESIPRCFDAAKLFYGDDIAPIFEVIVPMVNSAQNIDRIYQYYIDFVAGKQNKFLKQNDITVAEWIGEFKPEKINVIPLFEDYDRMLSADSITKEFLSGKNFEYQRVFLARSDPALNYGLISATLLNKIALQRLAKLEKEINVKIYPIVGVGSAPFRGNLRPQTVSRVLAEYPSVHTFTIQSSFKYDNNPEEVKKAIELIENREMKPPHEIDEQKCLEIIDRYSAAYQKQISELSDVINKVAKYIPSRRKRKLHIGLFGYSRSLQGIKLPRAITFTAALYSIGLPPEILGLNALSKHDFDYLKTVYINLENDIRDALNFCNINSLFMPIGLKEKIKEFFPDFYCNQEHLEISNLIVKGLYQGSNDLSENVLAAGNIRKFLG